VLLIDLSGSMKDEIDLIKATALHFLNVISIQDSVAVVTFTTDVTVVSHLTNDRDDLKESIEWMLAPAGERLSMMRLAIRWLKSSEK
jgi:Mg-chelatase subunit ChlD